jgi:PAS domain S-box-containing protein
VDIRTKLVFALVSVALVSMSLLGLFTYRSVEREFQARTVQQLEGLADFKAGSIRQILRGWHDRVGLVASRTQLRVSLAEHNRSGSGASVRRVQRILDDALEGSPLFVELGLYGLDGSRVATASADGLERVAPSDLLLDPSQDAIRYDGIAFRGTGLPEVTFTATLRREGEVVGYLRAVLRTEEVDAISRNVQGLGDTGETLVVTVDEEGQARVLHPVRFPPTGSGTAGFVVNTDGGAAKALSGEGGGGAGLVTDYRGESVWAATALIGETQWGIVVKVDQAEQALPITDFGNDMIKLAMTLAAFAILFGTILGFRFAQPIHLLAEAADRIRSGELDARADIRREDEVGALARTFDEMADALEQQVGLLTEYRRFFDVSMDMLCIASTDGYFKRVNPAFVHELGWPEEELLKRPFMDMVHPDDVAATGIEIERLAGGSPTISFENRFLCMDGSYKRLRWNSYPEEETGRLYSIARVRPPTPEDLL